MSKLKQEVLAANADYSANFRIHFSIKLKLRKLFNRRIRRFFLYNIDVAV